MRTTRTLLIIFMLTLASAQTAATLPATVDGQALPSLAPFLE